MSIMADRPPKMDDVLKLVKGGDVDKLKVFCFEQNNNRLIRDYYHNKTGDSVLSYVCRKDNVEMLDFFHKNCELDLQQANFEGKRPIHEAAQFGSIACLKYLISCNVSVDTIKKADWTPLMLACTKSNLEVIQQLLNSGANPILENKDGWTAFHIACREGFVDIIKYLHVNTRTSWDTVSKNGRTPLHTAALHGREAAVKYLLEHCDYKVDIKDSCGTTPLMDAIRAGFTNTAYILYDLHSANVSETDNLGRQALHLASEAGNEKSVLYLLEQHHIDVNVTSGATGVTPLHLACKEGHAGVADLLIQHGANVNIVDHKKRSALHIACGCQHFSCVEILLKYVAVNLQDETGIKASGLAQKPEIHEAFIKYGEG